MIHFFQIQAERRSCLRSKCLLTVKNQTFSSSKNENSLIDIAVASTWLWQKDGGKDKRSPLFSFRAIYFNEQEMAILFLDIIFLLTKYVKASIMLWWGLRDMFYWRKRNSLISDIESKNGTLFSFRITYFNE